MIAETVHCFFHEYLNFGKLNQNDITFKQNQTECYHFWYIFFYEMDEIKDKFQAERGLQSPNPNPCPELLLNGLPASFITKDSTSRDGVTTSERRPQSLQVVTGETTSG